MHKRYLAAIIGVSLAVGTSSHMSDAASPANPQSTAAKYGAWGVDLDARDLTVKPGDDFYRHVNGRWWDKTTIPADRVQISVGTVLTDQVELQVRAIAEEAANSADPSERKLLACGPAGWMRPELRAAVTHR